MPQIGQRPGPGLTTSGCMGQDQVAAVGEPFSSVFSAGLGAGAVAELGSKSERSAEALRGNCEVPSFGLLAWLPDVASVVFTHAEQRSAVSAIRRERRLGSAGVISDPDPVTLQILCACDVSDAAGRVLIPAR